MKTRVKDARDVDLRRHMRRSIGAGMRSVSFAWLLLDAALSCRDFLKRMEIYTGVPLKAASLAPKMALTSCISTRSGWIHRKFCHGLGPETWRSEQGRRFSRYERAGQRSRVERMRLERAQETKTRQETAARTAAQIWEAAAPAPKDHPYLKAKGVGPSGLKLHGDGRLIAPLRDIHGVLQSLQFIAESGEKRFLKGGRKQGCFLLFGDLDPQASLLVAEGWATAVSIHQAMNLPTVVAFDCTNLKAVGQAIRLKRPTIAISFCADDDAWSEGNPGVGRAREAAHAVGARLIVPRFADPRPEGATDFNDLLRAEGVAAVHASIASGLAGALLPITDADAIEAFVDRLARLDPIQYGQLRTAGAQILAVSVGDLNTAVVSRKRQLTKDAKASGAATSGASESAFYDD